MVGAASRNLLCVVAGLDRSRISELPHQASHLFRLAEHRRFTRTRVLDRHSSISSLNNLSAGCFPASSVIVRRVTASLNDVQEFTISVNRVTFVLMLAPKPHIWAWKNHLRFWFKACPLALPIQKDSTTVMRGGYWLVNVYEACGKA